MVSFFSAALSFSIFLCIGVSILLIIYTYKTKWYNWLLAAFFILLAYHCFVTVLISTGYILSYPHFYRTGHIACLLYMPLSYLYVRSVITDRSLSKKDILHIIPSLIYTLDYIPFFLLPGDKKMEFFTQPNLSRSVIMYNESKFFQGGFYVALKYLLAFFYWVLQSIIIVRTFRTKAQVFKSTNSLWLRWLVVFCTSQIFLFIPPFALLNQQYENNLWISFLFIGGGTGLTSVCILLFPRLLYGMITEETLLPTEKLHTSQLQYIRIGAGYSNTNGFNSDAKSTKEHTVILPVKKERSGLFKEDKIETESNIMPTSKITDINEKITKDEPQAIAYRHLSEERMIEIYNAILEYFAESKPYLKLHYTLQQLSIHMNIPSQYISIIIHEFEKVNFNDFVNKYRVEYCVSILRNNEHKSQTLEAVARKSGFNNRNTFTLAFKKIIGQTPSEYIKSIAGDQ